MKNLSFLKYSILALLLLLRFSLYGQDYCYLQYTTKDGLAGSTVHGISQDQSGFLWFATDAGLSRFDGKGFHTYTIADGLPSNEIFFVFCDSRNRLWIASFKNALCYFFKGKLYNQDNDPMLKQIKTPSPVQGIAEMADGRILITLSDGVYILPGAQNTPIIFIPKDRFHLENYRHFRITRVKGKIPVLNLPPALRKFVNDTMWYADYKKGDSSPDKYAFVGKKSMIITTEDTAKKLLLPYTNLLLTKFHNDSIFVVGNTLAGLRFYDFKHKRFIREYLPQTRVHDFYEDREGNFWFSTKGTGVFKLGQPSFVNYAFGRPERPFSVYQIFPSDGRIHVVTESGKYWQFPRLKKQVAQEPLAPFTPVAAKAGIDKLRLQPNTVQHFYDAELKDITDPLKSTGKTIKTIFYYNDTILMASSDGAFLFDTKRQRMLDTLFHSRTTCATMLRDTFYIGALNGLYRYYAGQLHYLGNESPLLRNRISTIVNGKDGMLWVGTYEGGIAGLRHGKVVLVLDKKTCGLSSNVCRCIFPDNHFLWVGTESGINKINLAKARPEVVARYDRTDGLRSNNINALYVDGSIVYAGSQDGITCFDESLVAVHGICDILFTGITVAGRSADPDTAGSLTVPHADNHLRFEYAGISFASAGNITYRYRLQGLSDDWLTTDQMFLDYPSLPSGAYTFQVMAINKFGDQSATLEKRFIIEQLLWERKGMKLLAAGVLVAVTGLLFQLRFRSVRKKDREQQLLQRKIATLEQKALRAQMNPHFIFNCLNSIQHFVLTSDIKGANFYLLKFAALVRSTLEHAAHMYIRLSVEMEYLANYLELEQMQTSSAFQYTIRIDPAIDCSQAMIPSMLMQPFLENAIKHGVSKLPSGGVITLELVKDAGAETISCTITDNGPGINNPVPQSKQQHTSRGISITQERIEVLNQVLDKGKIAVSVTHAFAGNTGTKVILSLPLLSYNEAGKQTQTL